MNNIVNINIVDPVTLEFQDYKSSDENLISSFELSDVSFDSTKNYIEYHVYDGNKNIILSDNNFKHYSLNDNNIVINPKEDLNKNFFTEGQFYSIYNFLTPLFSSSPDNFFYISEISSDRTEIRLATNILDPIFVSSSVTDFVSSSISLNYQNDFFLNFGNNNLLISNNILLDNTHEENPTILIKLYEPLPVEFDLNSQLWVVQKLSDSIAYSIEFITVFNDNNNIQLKGPNFDIPTKDRINNSTGYESYNSLHNTTSSFLSNQLNSLLQDKSIELNIDYSDYNNFIHFSSAQTRLENFYYKLTLIESASLQSYSASLVGNNFYVSSSQNVWDLKIQDIITNFDGYEYYLYFESSSTSWPKSNNIPPFINVPSTSSQGQNWLTGQLDTSSLFDSNNKDALINSIPSYLKEDPINNPYELFIEMIGHHFDNIYLYYTEISNKYNTDNRVDHGLSKDLIADVLKDFGIKIYQNNFSTNDLYSSFLGINPGVGLLPVTGSELITTFITASNQIVPLNDVNNEIYKRIYHNLPYLLKKKGTIQGLRTLITLYGIPDTILRINEFGGKNRNNFNDWDYFQDQFNYAFFTTSSGYLTLSLTNPSGIYGSSSYGSSSYGNGVPLDSPLSIEFRFRTLGIPSSSAFSQSLASFETGSNFNIVLEYTGSGNSSGSFSGSIVDNYNQYGNLKFIDSNNNSASIYLPFFNGDWWSVLVNVTRTNTFGGPVYTSSIFSKNKIYQGYDGNQIGFQGSSSIGGGNFWTTGSFNFYLSRPSSKTIAGKIYAPFSGSFQELRFYNTPLSQSVFDDFVMNPYSIEGNQLSGSQSSLNSLYFRAPLGSVLDNISSSQKTSIHPSITSYPSTQSFSTGNSYYYLSGSYSFIPNVEIFYFDQFPAGIKNSISDKIQIEENILPSDGEMVLSPFKSIQQHFPISESYTKDVNYLEVAFSPQNEIDDDIISQLGYFNIGDYIGDPRQLVNTTASYYPDFNKIRDNYFKKYQKNYNLNDYIRLIKYFDNSLFKLIKDFIPARSGLASGIVIKQHLLERNRYSPAQTSYLQLDISSSILSFPLNYNSGSLYKESGGSGGSVPNLLGKTGSNFTYHGVVNITQSWFDKVVGPKGVSYITHSSQDEFFNGIFSGSTLIASTQSLQNNPFLKTNLIPINYVPTFYFNVIGIPLNNFLDPNTEPNPGEIYLYGV